jgi:uncharacterized membrane protein
MHLTTWRFIRQTLVAGLFVLIPILFIAYILAQTFIAIRTVATPVIDYFGLQHLWGFVLLNLVAILIALIFLFLAGLLARLAFVSGPMARLDQAMSDRIPFYSMAKGILSGVVKDETSIDQMKSVVVRAGGGLRVGFEIERTPGGHVVVFLPNVPNPQTGTAMAFLPEEVEPVDLAPHQVLEMMQFFGKGLAAQAEAARDARLAAQKETAAPDTK